MISKTIFSVFFFLFLQTCGIIFKTCNAGNSEQYQNCITQLQKELSNRIGEDDKLVDAGSILNKIIENKEVLKENAFSKNIIQYIEKYRTRLDALIKYHTIHIGKDDLISSEADKFNSFATKDSFIREIRPESWKICLDYRTLSENVLVPESSNNHIHTFYYSMDANIFLYTLKSIQKNFFGINPKTLAIDDIREPSTRNVLATKPIVVNLFNQTKYGKILTRLESEIGLKKGLDLTISRSKFGNPTTTFSLSFDVEDNLSTQRISELKDNKVSIFRRFFMYIWREIKI
jgi:hypothetical protein